MAVIRARGNTITNPAEVTKYLADNGIEFATWGTDRVPKSISGPRNLTPEEKQQILDLYKPEIDALIAKNAYVTSDVVSLAPETPNLGGLLATFKKEHYHTDDEVRFVAAGRGIFYLKHKDAADYYECEVHPGDLIVVPANTWHYFDLCEDQSIGCVRIFKTKDGWVANFKPETQAASA